MLLGILLLLCGLDPKGRGSVQAVRLQQMIIGAVIFYMGASVICCPAAVTALCMHCPGTHARRPVSGMQQAFVYVALVVLWGSLWHVSIAQLGVAAESCWQAPCSGMQCNNISPTAFAAD
jgi:hypothetical protein